MLPSGQCLWATYHCLSVSDTKVHVAQSSRDVRYWHLASIRTRIMIGRLRGKANKYERFGADASTGSFPFRLVVQLTGSELCS